jgi:hypothetical protein
MFGNFLAAYFHKQAKSDMKQASFSHWSLKATFFTNMASTPWFICRIAVLLIEI